MQHGERRHVANSDLCIIGLIASADTNEQYSFVVKGSVLKNHCKIWLLKIGYGDSEAIRL